MTSRRGEQKGQRYKTSEPAGRSNQVQRIGCEMEVSHFTER